MIDRTEHGAGRRTHFEPFEVRPIELACRNLRKLLARDDDVGADPVASPVAIVEAVQFCDHAASVAMPFLHIEGVIDAVHPQRPRAESDNVVARLRVGLHFEPPFDAEHAADAAEDDPLLFRAHCGIAGRPKPLRRFGTGAVLLEQVRDPLRWLSTLADPVVDAVEIDAQPLLTACRDRIEEPDTLDVAPAARPTAVSHDEVIEGTLDRAAACQPNDHHSENPPLQKKPRRPDWAAHLGGRILLSSAAERKPQAGVSGAHVGTAGAHPPASRPAGAASRRPSTAASWSSRAAYAASRVGSRPARAGRRRRRSGAYGSRR